MTGFNQQKLCLLFVTEEIAMNVLVAYASSHGSTAEVAEFISHILEERGLKVTLADVDSVRIISPYDVVILGTAIHAGTWLPEMTDFVHRFQDALAGKPAYLWVSCIRVLEPHGYQHVLEYYMVDDLMEKLNIQDTAVFAGKLDLQQVDWNERWTLAARYDGDTWPSGFDGDFRDWDKIRLWSEKIAESVSAVE